MGEAARKAKLNLEKPIELSNAELTKRIEYLEYKTKKQQSCIVNYHNYTLKLEKSMKEYSVQHIYMLDQVNKAVINVDKRILEKAKKEHHEISMMIPVVCQLLEKMNLIAEKHEKNGFALFRADRAFDKDLLKENMTAMEFIDMAKKHLQDKS